MKLLKLVLVFVCMVPSYASAYNFTPTPEEFASWGLKCQAIYLTTQVGLRSEFVNLLPDSLLNEARSREKVTQAGSWHYCAGLIYFARYKRLPNSHNKKQYTLENAIKEVAFSANRVNKATPEFLEMNVYLGNLHVEKKDYQTALRKYDLVLKTNPSYWSAYLAKSILFNKQKNYQKALSTLTALPQKAQNSSAEIKYFIGLYYFKLGSYEQSTVYAREAYDMGYPLPGLKDLLKTKGYDI